jgi:hypothetical protein
MERGGNRVRQNAPGPQAVSRVRRNGARVSVDERVCTVRRRWTPCYGWWDFVSGVASEETNTGWQANRTGPALI